MKCEIVQEMTLNRGLCALCSTTRSPPDGTRQLPFVSSEGFLGSSHPAAPKKARRVNTPRVSPFLHPGSVNSRLLPSFSQRGGENGGDPRHRAPISRPVHHKDDHVLTHRAPNTPRGWRPRFIPTNGGDDRPVRRHRVAVAL